MKVQVLNCHGVPWTITTEAYSLKMEPWRVCKPVVADLHHFHHDAEQEPDPNQRQSVKLVPDPHQNEKWDPDPHQRDKK
jgi:hypothetical protein